MQYNLARSLCAMPNWITRHCRRSMMRGLLIFCLVSASSTTALLCLADTRAQAPLPTVELEINGHVLTTEIAASDQQRYMGLSFRKSLADDAAMLFVYQRERPLIFVMRNTLIPLSIAYLSKDMVINEIHLMDVGARQQFSSKQPAQYALEVNQGWFQRNGIKPGDSRLTEPLVMSDAADPNNRQIRTYHDGSWHAGSVPLLRSADHGTWLGTLVFDGARWFDGVSPDLEAHCVRVNHSCEALGMQPTHTAPELVALCHDGLSAFDVQQAVYIRPMYWSREHGPGFIAAAPQSTQLAICLEAIDMPDANAAATLTTTRFCRPTLDVATVNAKAACLYPNNARMISEAISKGFTNALVTDALGNVAETATSNIFMVKDGEVFTPIPNGTFLNGITRQRVISLIQADGGVVHETTLSLDDFRRADEVFMSGNLAKITPVTAFDDVRYEHGPVTQRARQLYMEWAHTDSRRTHNE